MISFLANETSGVDRFDKIIDVDINVEIDEFVESTELELGAKSRCAHNSSCLHKDDRYSVFSARLPYRGNIFSPNCIANLLHKINFA